MARQNILLNKPTYVNMSILDISKSFMYEFHYNHIKSTYGNRAVLLMTDTDSLIYSIEIDDLTNRIKRKFSNKLHRKRGEYYE